MKLRPFPLALLSVSVTVAVASGQIPGAKLNSLFPPSAQVGTTLEVSVDGRDLNGAQHLGFSHPGIRGEAVMAAGDEFVTRPQWQRNRFRVEVREDVPNGIYYSWFVGRYGISNIRPFVVSDLPQAVEATGNHTHETAAEVTINSAAVGRVDPGKADNFRIALKPGKPVAIDCQAKRLGSRLDAQIAVFDESGKQLIHRRSAGDRDPMIVFDPPHEGVYLIEISDVLSAGGSDRVFRLVVTDRPFIRSVFPPAAPHGEAATFRVSGANLADGGAASEFEIELPESLGAPAGDLPQHPRGLGVAGAVVRVEESNPLRISFASAPVIIEEPALAEQIVLPPCEIAGRLAPEADADAFVFEAGKGEQWIVEGISHRAGHASDLFFTISQIKVDADGERREHKLAEADDDPNNIGGRRAPTSSRDPLVRFTAHEDGRYIVRLLDQFQLGEPEASYRLAIRPPAPDFALMVEIENPITENKRLENWAPSLLRGGRVPIEVRALRRDGFDGEIELRLAGAPPGVEVVAGKIPKGKNSGVIMVSGTAELGDAVGDLKVFGKSGDMERQAERIRLANEVGDFDNEVVAARLGGPLLLATRGSAAPISVSADVAGAIEASIGGSIEIPLKWIRDGAFKGNAKFYLEGLPNIAKPASFDIDVNKAGEGKLTVPLKPTKENRYAPGRYEVRARGDMVLQYRPDPQGVVEAGDDQKSLDALVAKAGEALKLAETARDEIAKSELTEEEKKHQSVAADEAVVAAQSQKKAAEGAKARVAERLKLANARNAPRDTRLAA
ncbi:MAG: hypothetical protein ACR2RV_21590 [Verrucomicrobiales bacterium]